MVSNDLTTNIHPKPLTTHIIVKNRQPSHHYKALQRGVQIMNRVKTMLSVYRNNYLMISKVCFLSPATRSSGR